MSNFSRNKLLVTLSQSEAQYANEKVVWDGEKWKSAITDNIDRTFSFDVLGKPARGGYYIGETVDQHGTEYWLIIAPISSVALKQWKITTTVSNTTQANDGFANTVMMNNAWHEAAQYVMSLAINNTTDWYLPSRNELATIAQNMKHLPTTEQNVEGVFASSTEVNANNVYVYDVESDEELQQIKTSLFMIRAVRRVQK
jgi:hypothetical protein